ncbi:MAG: hypothetical protein WD037_06585 [Balneolales bacterium]
MNYFKVFSPLFIVVLMLSPLLTQDANSQSRDGIGLGVVVGEPSGVTAKLWLDNGNALAGVGAWSMRGNGQVHFHLDYHRQNFEALQVTQGELAFYYGLGGRILAGDINRIGVRVPFGLTYLFADDPLEVFVELAPILDLSPATEFSGNSGLGIRYYF